MKRPFRQAGNPERSRHPDAAPPTATNTFGVTPTLPSWATWSFVLVAASLYHLVIDLHLGLYGQVSADMSVLKGVWGLLRSTLMVWWLVAIVLGVLGNGAALRAALVITAVQFLGDGVVAIAVAPPPSDAFPWQDVAHFTALIAGALATWLTWQEMRRRGRMRSGRWIMVATVGLIVATMALSAPLNLAAISGGPR